ncbi:hypothetical protein ACHAXT_003431 [Thalassiosira profunda]
MMITPTAAAAAALLASPSALLAAAEAAARRRVQPNQGGHEHNPFGGPPGNPFEDGPNGEVTDDADYGRVPHRGCENFLKTNHEPQDLPAVNFRGKGRGQGQGGGQGGQGGPRSLSAAPPPVECTGGSARGYSCANLDLHSFIPLSYFGNVNDTRVGTGSDLWGWTHAATGREFALMGLEGSTAFVEITTPTDPTYLGILPGHTTCSSWRDIKTYSDHAFIVSEASGHGMQVFDLTQLLSVDLETIPVEFAETAHYDGFGNAHNIFINEDTGFAYAVGTSTYRDGLHIIDITTPTSPTLADHQDKEICFCSNEDTVTIVDVSDKSNPIQLSRSSYANDGYTHQGWLTEDGKRFVFNDETDELDLGGQVPTRTHVFNVEDLDNPVYKGFFEGTTNASDHNLYIKGDLVYQANYRGSPGLADRGSRTGKFVSRYDDLFCGNRLLRHLPSK